MIEKDTTLPFKELEAIALAFRLYPEKDPSGAITFYGEGGDEHYVPKYGSVYTLGSFVAWLRTYSEERGYLQAQQDIRKSLGL